MGDPARRIDVNSPEVEPSFESAPLEEVAEILDGVPYSHPRPARPHARGATRLTGRLRGFDDPGEGDPGGWVILVEPEMHLGEPPDKVVPDIAGWRRERMPDAIGPADAPYYFDLAPDWVCEFTSTGTQARDRGTKMRIYRREGVGFYWLADPVQHTLEIYRLEGGRYFLLDTYEGSAKVRAEPFDAIELDLAALWAR